MKRVCSLFIAFLSLAFNNLYSQDQPDQGILTIQISGAENRDGKIMLALCQNEAEFTNSDSSFRSVRFAVSEGITTYRFESIPFGYYAIKVFHDADDDGELNQNFFGLPTENYGFSNNARGSFGPASWVDARFKFEQSSDTVKINLE